MVELRPLRRRDIPILLRITRENMEDIMLASWGLQWSDDPLLEWLRDRHVETEVAAEKRRPIAYCSTEKIDNYLFITSLQVDKMHQGQGLGRRLLERVEAKVSDRSVEGVELCVQLTNASGLAFYSHMGYRVICRRGNNYLMRRTLVP
ncbi:MAG: GNAT family N-acetyltransferase [Methanomassiliicoccales archaeon]